MLDKGKKIASFTMAPVHKGKKTLKLPKLKKGKHKIQVVYLGNAPGLRLEVEEDHALRRQVSAGPVTAGDSLPP